MNKLTILGVISCLGALLLLGFQAIATLMKTEGKGWDNLSITDIANPDYLMWVGDIPWALLHQAVQYIITMPLFLLLFCIGGIFFIINAFTKV
ncbi:MAG: hypothetical protein GY859_16205 [Desulfobacterales bacterium]|nr:hypothetical protein [Desulfobacterales bacterium]